jgi:taurine-pyruvate aminotransferase
MLAKTENCYFSHVNMFGGIPAACALALANLEIMERESMIERASLLGARLRNELLELQEHLLVGDIRIFGFLMGIELVVDKVLKKPLLL